MCEKLKLLPMNVAVLRVRLTLIVANIRLSFGAVVSLSCVGLRLVANSTQAGLF